MNNNNNSALVNDRTIDGKYLPNVSPDRLKYPITLSALLSRLAALGEKYGLSFDGRTFPATEAGREEATAALKNQGGIYAWWCRTTGRFYIGSAGQFFGDKGRLTQYFNSTNVANSAAGKPQGKKNRNSNSTLSRPIAQALLKYGHDDFVLIVVASFSFDAMTRAALFALEQIWMLAYPTINLTLRVGSPVNTYQVQEEYRRQIEGLVHVHLYELDHQGQDHVHAGSRIVAGSHQWFHGIKYLYRQGVTLLSGVKLLIPAIEAQPALNAGTVLHGTLLLLREQLADITAWVPTRIMLYAGMSAALSFRKKGTVRLYAYTSHPDPNYVYTEADLVGVCTSVTEAQARYDVSLTMYRRLRMLLVPHKGLIHSNVPLHTPLPNPKKPLITLGVV